MICLPGVAGEFLAGFSIGAVAGVAGALELGDTFLQLSLGGRMVELGRSGRNVFRGGAAGSEREGGEQDGRGEPVHNGKGIPGVGNVNVATA